MSWNIMEGSPDKDNRRRIKATGILRFQYIGSTIMYVNQSVLNEWFQNLLYS